MAGVFDKGTIGSLEIRNRIVKSATLENMANLDGLPSQETMRFYERLARGGAGLIITGYAYVNKSGQTYPLQNGAHTDAVIERWRPVVDMVHGHGSRIAMQIVHGGRQTKMKGNCPAQAPSRLPNLAYNNWSRAMTGEEILQTVEDFARAAGRCREAGFDAVQIHAAHGYLVSNFLSPLMNRRKDGWGGDPERRYRFLGEVYAAVRRQVGQDYPVLAKMNMSDGIPFGLRSLEACKAAMRLAGSGCDALEISAGNAEVPFVSVRGDAPTEIFTRGRNPLDRLIVSTGLRIQKRIMPFSENYFRDYARELKPGLSIPLILVGGIRSLQSASEILECNDADFVSLARPLVREPSLPRRWAEGTQDRATCTSCNRCLAEIDQGSTLRCYLKG